MSGPLLSQLAFFAVNLDEHLLVSLSWCCPSVTDVDGCQEAGDRLAISPPRQVVAEDVVTFRREVVAATKASQRNELCFP